jgi:hypothetical protein
VIALDPVVGELGGVVEHFWEKVVDEPAITDTVPARPSRVDDQRGEALHPPINRHVINVDTALRE